MGQFSATNSAGHSPVDWSASATIHAPAPSAQPLPEPDFSSARQSAVLARLTRGMGPPRAVDAGQQFARELALGHYENFSVISLLLPRHLRQDFCNVYAFCRIADDMADELSDETQAMTALGHLRRQTLVCYERGAQCLLFAPLEETIRRHDIPSQPFLDLIDAFEQDQRIRRYDNLEQVLDYCRRSANPVGRLVLYMCGYRDARRQALSDQTCTALQLANFWQDVRRDLLDRERIYLPADGMSRHGVSEAQIRAGRCGDGYRAMMSELVNMTEGLFHQGQALLPLIDPSVRRQISLFGEGGRAVLSAIRRQNFDTLSRRPRISRLTKIRLMLLAVAASLFRSHSASGGLA